MARPSAPRLQMLLPLVLALLSLVVSAYASYSSNDKEIATRITAVETLQGADRDAVTKRLDRIENKLDLVLINQMRVVH